MFTLLSGFAATLCKLRAMRPHIDASRNANKKKEKLKGLIMIYQYNLFFTLQLGLPLAFPLAPTRGRVALNFVLKL